MMTVFDILEHLEGLQGTKAKQVFLAQHKDNDLLKEAFRLTLDPYLNFFVSKAPKVQPGTSERAETDNNLKLLFLALEQCSSRQVTGNAAKDVLKNVLAKMSPTEQKWAARIVTRKLRIGVGESSVEDTWPGLVPAFECMLANKIEWEVVDGKLKLTTPITYPVRVEPKWDGFRCIAVKKDGAVTLYARSGNIFDRAPKVQAWLEAHLPDGWVLDGEIIAENRWNDTASIIGSRKNHKDDTSIQLHVFDCIPLCEWQIQGKTGTFAERLGDLHDLLDEPTSDLGPVRIAEGHRMNSEDEVIEYYKKCLNKGLEGVMIKTYDTKYEFKRTDAVMKLKPHATFDGVVVDVVEAREGTKWDGMQTICLVQLPSGAITRVGNGYNDEEREYINSMRQKLVGRAMEVRGCPNLTDDGKILFPRFERWREDFDLAPEVKALQDKVRNGDGT